MKIVLWFFLGLSALLIGWQFAPVPAKAAVRLVLRRVWLRLLLAAGITLAFLALAFNFNGKII